VKYIYSYDTLGPRGEQGAWPHGGGARHAPPAIVAWRVGAVDGRGGGGVCWMAPGDWGWGGGGGMEVAMLYGEEADFWVQRQQALAVLEQRVLQVWGGGGGGGIV